MQEPFKGCLSHLVKKKKKKTCNYCILTPKQAITSQKLSPGNQTLAWLIRLTSLAKALIALRMAAWDTRTTAGPGPASQSRPRGVCFYCSFLCVLRRSPFPETGSHQKARALYKPDPFIAQGGRSWKKKREKKATKVVNSFQHRKSVFAL